MIDAASLPYRPCVGLCLLNADGLIFAGRRLDGRALGRPDAWQMPQGGVDAGEEAEVAAFRELEEETGLKRGDVALIRRARKEVFYDLPEDLLGKIWDGKYRGQRQIWFAMRMTAGDEAINIATEEPEFDAWAWMSAAAILEAIVPFKREVYRQVFAEFSDLLGA